MDEPPPTPVRNKIPPWKSDWNSNEIVNTDSQTEQLDCEPTCDVIENRNTSQKKSKSSVTFCPTQTIAGVKQKDISYDDLSKNIDANLAEIDMETFRSEDINSILALPAIYSGNYESVNHGEQCASVSGSLLNGLEIEASVSNRNSEDEISICKDEPLFSPQREPPVHERAISVDSLDSSSSYDQDLVLTCKANKNNYTIVFEGSETQFSEDSEYHSGGRSSEGESIRSEAFRMNHHHANVYTSNSMIQSDLVFTTWSNLKKTHIGRRRSKLTEISIKSQSLPNLFCQSALVCDKKLSHLAKLRKIKNSPFTDLDCSQQSGLQIIRPCCYPYSLSLVKLFMKYKVSSRSSVCSSEQSSSSNSLNSHSFNNVNNLHSSTKTASKVCEAKEKSSDLTNQNYNIKNIGSENLNNSCKRQLFMDNIKVREWHTSHNARETNNNSTDDRNVTTSDRISNNRLSSCNNNNNAKETGVNNTPNTVTTPSNGECDNSQYFEDSLIEAPVLQAKNFHATPIKEEEETDISSGDDELMKTSAGSDNNCDSASDDVLIIQNNALDVVSNIARQDNDHNLERINNIFPTSKSNLLPAATGAENERMSLNKAGQFLQNQLQDTQTKHCNGNFSVNTETSGAPASASKGSGRQISGVEHMLIRHSSSREASPNSSGYVSSRHSSLERLQRSMNSAVESPSRSLPSSRACNIQLTKSRSCSTQIPVHVKDCCLQTSMNASLPSNVKYVFVNSSGEIVSRDSSKEDISDECIDKQDTKPKMYSKFSSTMHTSLDKEDKCIYVCFPNYSLPDLSFLNSVASENASSVFMSPTKFKPPREMIKTLPNDPSESIDATCRKRLLNIKDLDSLRVLLPDNLKHLINCIHSEKEDSETVSSEALQSTSDSTRIVPESVKSKEALKMADAMAASNCKQPSSSSGILRKCSVAPSRSKEMIPTPVCCQIHKACPVPKSQVPASIQACNDIWPRPCICQYPTLVSGDPLHSAIANCGGVHIPSAEQLKVHNRYPGVGACAADVKYKESKAKSCPQVTKEQADPCGASAYAQQVSARQLSNPGALVNGFCLDGVALRACCQAKTCHHPAPSQPPLVEEFDTPFRHGINSCCSSRKEVISACQESGNDHCCHTSARDEKISNLQFNASGGKSQESPNSFHGCGELIDSDAPPQEFLVSPAQNSPCGAAPPDLYMLQSSTAAEDANFFHSSLRKKTGLVENLQKAAVAIYDDYLKNKCNASCCTSFSVGQKILTSLCPAVHTILSDGLLPSVQGFFGPLPNSPWKVAEASIQLENSKKGVQDMLKQVNSEKLLTDSTYRFNAFIIGLLNLGCLEWWLGHLLSSRSLICHHYHPTALLSLLSLPASTHLQQELKELVSPLTNLAFNLDLAFETRMAASKNHGKCASSCCSSDSHKSDKRSPADDCNMNKVPHFTFCFTHKELEKGKAGAAKSSKDEFVAEKRSSKSDKESQPPWPGITINPFPNVQTAEEVSKKFFPKASEQKKASSSANHRRVEHTQVANACPKSKMHDRRIVAEAMCSSTDSGCSSQAALSRDISSAATDSAESESHSSGKQDVQQFRKLQQKWEKLTHADEKHASLKAAVAQNMCVAPASVKKVTEQQPLVRKVEKGQVRMNVRDGTTQSNARRVVGAASKTSFSKPDVAEGMAHERRQQQPGASVASKQSIQKPEKEKRSKSQIPLLRTPKNAPQKSRIPIQKSAARAHSANREHLRHS